MSFQATVTGKVTVATAPKISRKNKEYFFALMSVATHKRLMSVQLYAYNAHSKAQMANLEKGDIIIVTGVSHLDEWKQDGKLRSSLVILPDEIVVSPQPKPKKPVNTGNTDESDDIDLDKLLHKGNIEEYASAHPMTTRSLSYKEVAEMMLEESKYEGFIIDPELD